MSENGQVTFSNEHITNLVCAKCENPVFGRGYLLGVISALAPGNPTGKDFIAESGQPVGWYCINCGYAGPQRRVTEEEFKAICDRMAGGEEISEEAVPADSTAVDCADGA